MAFEIAIQINNEEGVVEKTVVRYVRDKLDADRFVYSLAKYAGEMETDSDMNEDPGWAEGQ